MLQSNILNPAIVSALGPFMLIEYGSGLSDYKRLNFEWQQHKMSFAVLSILAI